MCDLKLQNHRRSLCSWTTHLWVQHTPQFWSFIRINHIYLSTKRRYNLLYEIRVCREVSLFASFMLDFLCAPYIFPSPSYPILALFSLNFFETYSLITCYRSISFFNFLTRSHICLYVFLLHHFKLTMLPILFFVSYIGAVAPPRGYFLTS
jgi:hypothetical protein